jgi:subtilisin family serine protease
MNRRLLLGLAAALAVGACNDQQQPNTGNPDPGTDFASTSATTQINVILKSAATAANRTELSKYGTIYDEIPQLRAVLMRAKTDQIRSISALPFVASVGADAERNIGPIDLIDPQTVSFAGQNNVWNLDAVNVTDKASAGRKVAQDGSNVYVAVLDTGLLPSWRAFFPEARIATQYAKSFGGGAGPTDDNVSEQPNKWEQDTYSHGTHVTSIILGFQYLASSTNGFFQVDGVAPNATIIPVKVLNQNGNGWSSAIAKGVVYIADLAPAGVLDGKRVVINMSLGGSVLDPVEKAALDYAAAHNVVVVASAGNSGPDGAMGFPGAYPSVISVAAAGWTGEWNDPAANCSTLGSFDALLATRFWRQCDVPDPYSENNFYITDFSAKAGPTQDLDVAAPGSWVVGPWQEQQGTISYFFVGGTSQASPHVAGIVALMLQKDPALPAGDVEDILESAAKPLAYLNQQVRPGSGPTPFTPASVPSWGTDRSGHGFITADAALKYTH